MLNSIFYRVPQELSREILKFINPIGTAKIARTEFIKKRGIPKFRWCSICGEYLASNTEWIFIDNYTDTNAWCDLILYKCNSCKNLNTIYL
mgnify:FL=1